MSDFDFNEIDAGIKRSEAMARRQKIVQTVLILAGSGVFIAALAVVAFIAYSFGTRTPPANIPISNPNQNTSPRQLIVPSKTLEPTVTVKSTYTVRPSSTPAPKVTAKVVVSQLNLYQGPGMGYYLVNSKIYKRGEIFTVLAKDEDGYWFLCESSNGTEGWLFSDWVELSTNSTLNIPTASSIPPVPPTPTRRPKNGRS